MLLRDRGFLKEFNRLYWGIVLQNVVVLSVNLVDNIMLGAYSEVALSGATAVNQVQFVLQQVVMAFGNALMVLSSQYWGQKREGPIKRLAALAMAGAVGSALVLGVLCSMIPEGMVRLFTEDAAIVNEGVKYLRILRWSFVIFAATMVLQQLMQSVGTVKLALAAAAVALVSNLGLNALLIPRWGAEGAATATLIARVLEFLFTGAYVLKIDRKVRMRLGDFLKFNGALARDFGKVVAPLMMISVIWGVTTALQTATLGHMEAAGAGTIAASSMATTLFSVLKTAMQGSASVANIMVGAAVGRGDIRRVKELAKTLQAVFLMIGAITSTTLFLLRAPILSLYNLRPETKALANKFLLVLCVTALGSAYQMPTIMGIVRGGGDTRFGMINDMATILGFVVPVSLLAAFVWNWPPEVVVLCQNSDQLIKCVAGAIRVNGDKWIKPLTRQEA